MHMQATSLMSKLQVSVCVCVSMCLGVTGLVSLKNASGEGP